MNTTLIAAKSGRPKLTGLVVAGAVIVLVCVVLRRHGHSWGLPPDRGPTITYHVDERKVLDMLSEMSVARRAFVTPSGYLEGPLQYLVSALLLHTAKQLGLITKTPDESRDAAHDAQNIAFLRKTVVAYDCVAVVLLLWLGSARFGRLAGVMAALVYAVVPAVAVQAHYARSHNLANLLLILTFFASHSAQCSGTSAPFGPWFVSGFLTSLATATRYNMLSVGLFPAAATLILLLDRTVPMRRRLAPLFWVTLGVIVGSVMAMPALILHPGYVADGLAFERNYTDMAQFSGWGWLDLKPVWLYLTWLLPIGTYPLLWIVLYAAMIFTLVMAIKQRDGLQLALPLFALLYLYFMGKGFRTPMVRAGLPVLAAGALMVLYVFQHLADLRKIGLAVALLVVGLSILSARYTWAYGTGMAGTDACVQAASWIDDQVPKEQSIGVLGPGFSLRLLERTDNGRVLLRSLAEEQSAAPIQEGGMSLPSWLVVCSFEDNTIAPLVTQNYMKRRVFRNLPHLNTACVFDHAEWPPDWSVPFPTVSVFERQTNR